MSIKHILHIDQSELQTRKGPGLLCGDCPVVLQVPLVAHQHDHDVRVGVVVQLFQPSLGALVGQVLGDVVDQQGSDCSPVIPASTRRERHRFSSSIMCGHGVSMCVCVCVPTLR